MHLLVGVGVGGGGNVGVGGGGGNAPRFSLCYRSIGSSPVAT